jgi:hypothetical protein
MACICLAQNDHHWKGAVNMPWIIGYHKKPCYPIAGVKDVVKIHLPLAVIELRSFGRPVDVRNNVVTAHFRLATGEEF